MRRNSRALHLATLAWLTAAAGLSAPAAVSKASVAR